MLLWAPGFHGHLMILAITMTSDHNRKLKKWLFSRWWWWGHTLLSVTNRKKSVVCPSLRQLDWVSSSLGLLDQLCSNVGLLDQVFGVLFKSCMGTGDSVEGEHG